MTGFDDEDLESMSNIGILKLPEGKDGTSVAADFLEYIYKHTMAVLAKQMSEEALAATPIEFWFTMPAILVGRSAKRYEESCIANRICVPPRRQNLYDHRARSRCHSVIEDMHDRCYE